MIAVPPVLFGRIASMLVFGSFILVCLAALSLPVYWAFHSQDSEVEVALRGLGGYQAKIGARPKIQADFEALNLQGRTLPGIMAGETSDAVRTQMQSEVRAIIEANGGVVRGTAALPPARQQGLDIIAVQYDFSLPMSHLRDFTYAIESHLPYFIMERVLITAPMMMAGDARSMSEPKLEIRATIRGYRWAFK